MRGSWIVLIGIGAMVLYGLVSHGVSGSWNFALSFEIGAVVALALSGFRPRPMENAEKVEAKCAEEKVKVEGQDQERNSASGAHCAFTGGEDDDSPLVGRFNGEATSSLLRQQNELGATHPVLCQPQPPTSTFTPTSTLASAEAPEALWERALSIVASLDPSIPPEECESYMTLVRSAAEGGHVAALAHLGELAFGRWAFVEAYFWTKMARHRLELEDPSAEQGLKEIDGMLRKIRREWAAAGQPLEFENVYDSFPEERGELGRAFLRLDSGIEIRQTREYIRLLADKGNPDAALFVGEKVGVLGV